MSWISGGKSRKNSHSSQNSYIQLDEGNILRFGSNVSPRGSNINSEVEDKK